MEHLNNTENEKVCSLWAVAGLQAAWTAPAEPTWQLQPSAGSGCSGHWFLAGSSGVGAGAGTYSYHVCSDPKSEQEKGVR